MALTFTIAGVDKTLKVRAAQLEGGSTVHYSRVVGTPASLSLQVYDLDGVSGFRAAIDDTLVVADGATTLCAAIIGRILETSLSDSTNGWDKGVLSTLTCLDRNGLLLRDTYTKTYPDGTTLKAILQDLITAKLGARGITLDPAQANGPAPLKEVAFVDAYLDDILNALQTITGWPWDITPGNVLSMISPGSVPCGFSLTDSGGDVYGGITTEKGRNELYANRITLIAGPSQQIVKLQTFTGNGVATSFALAYPPVENNNYILSQGYVSDGGVNYPLESTIGGVRWAYNHASFTMERTPPLANGNTAQFNYTVQFPITVTVNDAAEQAAHGVYSRKYTANDVFDILSATQLATGLLNTAKNTPKEVTVSHRKGMSKIGQSVPLTFAEHAINGTFMITEVEFTNGPDGLPTYTIHAIEGSQLQPSWLDYFRTGSGGNSVSSAAGSVSGQIIPALSGMFSGDLLANAGGIAAIGPFESSLRGALSNSTTFGPSVRLGRGDRAYAWDIVADTFFAAGARARLKLVPLAYGQGSWAILNCALQLVESAAAALGSKWYVLPGKPSIPLFLGNYDGGAPESSPDDIIAGILTKGLKLLGPMEIGNRIKPATLAANTHNWNPTDLVSSAPLSTASRIYVAASAAIDLTGLVGQNDGRSILFTNAGGFDITLKNDSALSTLGNRFVGANFTDVVVRANNGNVWLNYSTSSGFGYWYVHGPMDDTAAALGLDVPHTWTAPQNFAAGITLGDLENLRGVLNDGRLSLMVTYNGQDYEFQGITPE